MTATMKLEGFEGFERNLANLERLATRRAVARRALKKAAQPMADLAQSMAPVGRGSLKASIIVGTKAVGADAGKAAFAETLRAGGSRQDAVSALRDARRSNARLVKMYVGPGRHPQAIFQEFGTTHHAPQPFMRPAWDQDHKALLQRLGELMAKEIDKAITRQARRAARR